MGSSLLSSTTHPWQRCMALIQHCTDIHQLKAIHAVFTTHGIHRNTYALSKLISFCALSPSGSLPYASLLFRHTSIPNPFIYNTLIRAYSRSPHPHRALDYFRLMLRDASLAPDHHTFPFVLIACMNARWVDFGEGVHCWVVKNSLGLSDGHVQTALLRFYTECVGLGCARKVFDEIPQRDVFQWDVMINGYLGHGFDSEGLGVFREMLGSDVEPDGHCIATALTACARTGALQQGKWIHEYVKRRNALFEDDVFVGTALVDMYAKCGCIEKAVEVFEGMGGRNVYSWAAVIGGFAVHGFAKEALSCLERMVREDGIHPDGVVLLAVLTACTHVGLEEEGRFILYNMKELYGVVPKYEHYSCTVDLLCRANRLVEALALIQSMPMKPLASVWGSMLSACNIHRNVEFAELAAEKLLQLEHHHGAEEDVTYVQLSNIYLNAQRSDDARRMRKMMGDKGIKKTAGCSVVEVNGKVNEFVAGDATHPFQFEIHGLLDLLSLHMTDRHFENINI